MMSSLIYLLIIFCIIIPTSSFGAGNISIENIRHAKKILEKKIYYDHRVTVYCQASFDATKKICLPDGFVTPEHSKRAFRVEWEHIVPVENFGRSFEEWRNGDPVCVDSRGKSFLGRRCAQKANEDFRRMEADMYNLYPAIGAVNAMRANYNFRILEENIPPTFGSCDMKICGNKVEPPEHARGVIARTYKYMDASYPNYKMSHQQKNLMDAWDEQYPVDEWECIRASRIETIQGNENLFVKTMCIQKGLWPSH